MSKIAGLFDWYWVLLSLWAIGAGVIGLFHLTPGDFVIGVLWALLLVGGLFWFFSGNRPRPS